MALSERRRAVLERKGASEVDVQKWLGLSDAEMKVVELRVRLSREVRHRRMAAKMTQEELATRIGVSQPRIPEIEKGASSSLESMVLAYLATGADMADLGRVVQGTGSGLAGAGQP